MILDASALVAILMEEPSKERLIAEVLDNETFISAPTLLETYMVLKKYLGDATESELTRVLHHLGVEVVDFTADQVALAARAFDSYGKGRHPAALNFGDCIAYAVAKSTSQKLLFVGNDFGQTDVSPALTS
jgi:ribonuclease VapC